MLYFLLIIIAIGVLQLSTEGKGLLNSLYILALIAGGIYLVFWIVIIAIAFFTSDTGKSFFNGTIQLVEGILVLVAIYYGWNYLIKLKNKDKRVEVWKKLKESYKKNKVIYILAIIVILAVIYPYLLDLYYKLFQ